MPRPRKPARLVWHPCDTEWFIHDGPLRARTGCREPSGGPAAEQALRRYLSKKPTVAPQNAAPDEVSIGAILEAYALLRAATVAAPATMGYSIARLAAFWGDLTPADVNESRCVEYAAIRAEGVKTKPTRGGRGARLVKAGPGTVRRELGVLQAALRHALKARLVREVYTVSFPTAPPPRERALTRSEAAWILRAAAPHVRRFVVVALYSGRRASAILELGWRRSRNGGWVDVRNRTIDFRRAGQAETRKRRGAIAAPDRLMAHMRRWAKLGGERVVEWRGEPIAKIDTAFAAACRRAEALAAARGIEIDLSDVSPHTLKHTSVAWFFQRGGRMEDATSYFATSAATLEDVYRKHSPEHQAAARDVRDRRR